MSPSTNNCVSCNKTVSATTFLNCCNCKSKYHLLCANVLDKQYQAMTRNGKSTWKCSECRRPSTDSSCMPQNEATFNKMRSYGKDSQDPTNVKARLTHNTSSSSLTDPDENDYLELKIRNIIKQELNSFLETNMKTFVSDQLKQFSELIIDFNNSVTYFNQQFETLKTRLEEKDEIIKKLQNDNERLLVATKEQDIRISLLEQNQRESNIEINGIPEHKSENNVTTFVQLAKTVGEQLTDGDILHATRVAKLNPDNKRPRSLIVKLKTPRLRDTLLAAVAQFNKKHQKDKLNSHHLGISDMIVAEAWKANYLYWLFPALIIFGLLAILGLIGLVFAIRLYVKWTCGIYQGKTRMEGKTVIVTGCTSGIGKETAKELAKRGARVIMACRNLDAAERVKAEIIESTRNTNIVVKKLDLSSFTSIREFAKDILKTEQRLDVLVHNAGYAGTFKKNTSVDKLEMTMATNHYGPFLLTHLLIDLLKKNAPSRIVVVASSLYRIASFDLSKPNPVDSMPGLLYYASKEANILFTKELARRLEGTGVTANCLHPGLIDTGIWRSVPAPLSWGLYVINKCFFKNPKQGCQTTVMLAVDEKLEKVTGKYFSDCQESSLSQAASDMGKAKKLWELSEMIVNLEESDPKIL